MNRFLIVIMGALLEWVAGAAAVPPPAPEMANQPNLIVILADDLGYGDLSCYGNQRFETPSLDQMASEGMRFTDFHSSGPVCSPTRAGLLTGRYQQRSGIPGVINAAFQANRHHGLSPEEWTFAEALQGQGYHTAMFGKWHLGYRAVFNPIHHGFEVFKGYVSGNVDYHAHIDRMGVQDWWQNDLLADETGYTTELITQHALSYLEAHAEDRFCLYLAYEAPHDPYQGTEDPPIRVEGKVVSNRYEPGRIPRAYKEMVQTMDQGIGRILTWLKSQELDRQTLVFFFSDNGANRNGSNAGLRGFKGGLYEGGHRVPAIAWWPETIPSNVLCNDLTISLDVMPTLLELSGASVPANHVLDGLSLTGAWTHGSLPHADRLLFWSYGNYKAMRQGPWKYLVQEQRGHGEELYDLSDHLDESRNVAGQHAERVQSMRQAYERWHASVMAGARVQDTSRH